MLNIEDVLESLSSPLLGIIPESEEVLCASNIGAPVTLKARTREIRRALSNFPTALDDFVQYATSQGPRGGPAYVDTADPERRLRFALAICHLTLSHRQTRTGDSSFAQP